VVVGRGGNAGVGRERMLEVQRECGEAEERSVRVKSNIVRMLNEVNQKGDKRFGSGYQPAVNNLTLLAKIIEQISQ
jgi:hypothetical protein